MKAKHSRVASHYQISVTANEAGDQAVAVTWTRRPQDGSMVTHPGVYCLRSSETDWDEDALWRTYTTLTDVEAVFRPDLCGPRHQSARTVYGLQRAGPTRAHHVLPLRRLPSTGFRRLAGAVSRDGPLPALPVHGRGREDTVPAMSGPGGSGGAAAVPSISESAGRARRWGRAARSDPLAPAPGSRGHHPGSGARLARRARIHYTSAP